MASDAISDVIDTRLRLQTILQRPAGGQADKQSAQAQPGASNPIGKTGDNGLCQITFLIKIRDENRFHVGF